MKKADVRNAFSYMESLPDYPTQNVIGFAREIVSTPSAVICYFQKKLFKEILGAVNIVVFEEPPSYDVLMRTFEELGSQLLAKQGKSKVNKIERHYFVWLNRGYVITMTINNGIVAIRYGNPQIDAPSRIALGIKDS